MKNNNKGFTLIELIMVTIILGILAAVAVPRYMGTVNRAEAAAEDAVLSVLKANAEEYSSEEFQDKGRKDYPSNPFDGASVDGYVGVNAAITSGQWTYVEGSPCTGGSTGYIKHKRNDDSQWKWLYSSCDDSDDQADDRGSFGPRLGDGTVNGDAPNSEDDSDF